MMTRRSGESRECTFNLLEKNLRRKLEIFDKLTWKRKISPRLELRLIVRMIVLVALCIKSIRRFKGEFERFNATKTHYFHKIQK